VILIALRCIVVYVQLILLILNSEALDRLGVRLNFYLICQIFEINVWNVCAVFECVVVVQQWDLVTLTQNYLKLLIHYLREGTFI